MRRSVVLVAVAVLGLVAACGPSEGPGASNASPTTAATAVTGAGFVNEVRDVAVAADGAIWAATGAGIVRWQTPTSQPRIYVEGDGLPARNVSFVATAKDGSVWAAGHRWVARYDGQWEVAGRDSVPVGGLGDLAVAPDGTPWIAVGRDLLRLVGKHWVAVDPPPVTGGWPWTGSMAVAPDGTVWASSNSGELDAVRVLAYDGTWTEYGEADGIAGRAATVAVSGDGTVWVGGDGLYTMTGDVLSPASGVSRFASGTWTVFTTRDGLVADDADVVVGPDATVWAVSSEVGPKGISRFGGARWTRFPDLGGHGRGAAVDSSGMLWMPSDAGIVGFDGTRSTRLMVAPEQAPAPVLLPGFTLTAAKGVEPLRTSTSIDDFEWTTYESPLGQALFRAEGTPFGFVATDLDTHALWWSSDGVTWAGSVTPIGSPRLVRAGEDVVLYDGGAVRYAWDGAAWVGEQTLDVHAVQDVSRMAFGPKGAVAAGGSFDAITYAFAPDSVHFRAATAPPDKRLLTGSASRCDAQSEPAHVPGPLLATPSGFVALTSANPEQWNQEGICGAVAWTSPDGDRWALASPESPFGTGSTISDIAERDGRFVAVGSAAAPSGSPIPVARVWTSTDGITWQVAGLDVGTSWGLTVDSGPLGWIATAMTETSAPLAQMWTSPDGLAWAGPHPLPEGFRSGWIALQLAVGADSIFGIGGREPYPEVVARRVA
jgi:hypothetical protein